MARSGALILVLVALAGCGGSPKVVREPPVRAGGGTGSGEQPAQGQPPASGGSVRIAVVTHGQASSPFWAIVRNGVQAAARQMNAQVDYEAPDVYSLQKMSALIAKAVASHPDGLVVSIPEPGLAPAIRRAVRAGIPVVSINSGSDVFRSLGVLAHVGQPEGRAGFSAGTRLARAGVRRALCVNQQVGNQGLDARCAGLERAMRAAGGSSRVLAIDDQSKATPERVKAAVAARRADGILAMNATGGLEAAGAVAGLRRRVRVGVFDLTPEVLQAVQKGTVDFAVDQQPYLQGYLPVVMLVNRARYGLFPSQGDVVATGANFVTRENAQKAIELSERSIR